MNSQTRLTTREILSVLNVKDDLQQQYWAEYAGSRHTGIYFGCIDNRLEVEYDYWMKVAIAKLRRLGYNAHRTDEKLLAHGVVYPEGFHPREPQKKLGAVMVFRLDCTQEIRQQFLKAISSGETVEIDRDLFYYYLGVLPPQSMGKFMQWMDEQGQEWGLQGIQTKWTSPQTIISRHDTKDLEYRACPLCPGIMSGQQTSFIFAEGCRTIAFWTQSDICSNQALKQYFCKQVPVGARLI